MRRICIFLPERDSYRTRCNIIASLPARLTTTYKICAAKVFSPPKIMRSAAADIFVGHARKLRVISDDDLWCAFDTHFQTDASASANSPRRLSTCTNQQVENLSKWLFASIDLVCENELQCSSPFQMCICAKVDRALYWEMRDTKSLMHSKCALITGCERS